MPYLVAADLPQETAGARFRKLLERPGILQMPGAYNGLSAEYKAIVDAGIPTASHIGLTPHTIAMFGGFKIQGRTADAAMKILEDALAIEDALDEGLPRAYTPDLYKSKCSVVFEHVFEKFGEASAS